MLVFNRADCSVLTDVGSSLGSQSQIRGSGRDRGSGER